MELSNFDKEPSGIGPTERTAPKCSNIPSLDLSSEDLTHFLEAVVCHLCTKDGTVDESTVRSFLDAVHALREDQCDIIRSDEVPGTVELLAFLRAQASKYRSEPERSNAQFFDEFLIALPIVFGMALRSPKLEDLDRVSRIMIYSEIHQGKGGQEFLASLRGAGYRLIAHGESIQRNRGLALIQKYSSGVDADLCQIAEQLLKIPGASEKFVEITSDREEIFRADKEDIESLVEICWELVNRLVHHEPTWLDMCSRLLSIEVRATENYLEKRFEQIRDRYGEIPIGIFEDFRTRGLLKASGDASSLEIAFALEQGETRGILLCAPAIGLMLEGKVTLTALHDILIGKGSSETEGLTLSAPVVLLTRLLNYATIWAKGSHNRILGAQQLLRCIIDSPREESPTWPLAGLHEAAIRMSFELNGEFTSVFRFSTFPQIPQKNIPEVEELIRYLFSKSDEGVERFDRIFRTIFCLPLSLHYLVDNPRLTRMSLDAAYEALIFDGTALDLDENLSKGTASEFLREALAGLLKGFVSPFLAAAKRLHESEEFADVLADFPRSKYLWEEEISGILQYAISPEDLRSSLDFVYQGFRHSGFATNAGLSYHDVVAMTWNESRFLGSKPEATPLLDHLRSLAAGVRQIPLGLVPPMTLKEYVELSEYALCEQDERSPEEELAIAGHYFHLFGAKAKRKELFRAYRRASLSDASMDIDTSLEIPALLRKINSIVDVLFSDTFASQDSLDRDIVSLVTHADWSTYSDAGSAEKRILDWPQIVRDRFARRESRLMSEQKQTRTAAKKRIDRERAVQEAFSRHAESGNNRFFLSQAPTTGASLFKLLEFDLLPDPFARPSYSSRRGIDAEMESVLRRELHDLLALDVTGTTELDSRVMSTVAQLFEAAGLIRRVDDLSVNGKYQVWLNIGAEIREGIHDDHLFRGFLSDVQEMRKKILSHLHLDEYESALERYVSARPLLPPQAEKPGEGAVEISINGGTGLLRDLSGFVSDVCWARDLEVFEGKENVFFVAFRRIGCNPASQLVGGTLVILAHEAESGREEPVFVVRGFNPHPQLTEDLYHGELFEKTIEYLRVVGRDAGIRHILVPHDRGPMQALTNSPDIYYFVRKHYFDGPRLRCGSRQLTEFNHQVIHNKLVVLEPPLREK